MGQPAIVLVHMVVQLVTSAAAAWAIRPAIMGDTRTRSSGCPWTLAATAKMSATRLGAIVPTRAQARTLACPHRAVVRAPPLSLPRRPRQESARRRLQRLSTSTGRGGESSEERAGPLRRKRKRNAKTYARKRRRKKIAP